MKTRKWPIYHVIHVSTPYRYYAKLFITDVPEHVDGSEVWDTVESAGYWFGEFGIRRANHAIASSSQWPADVRRDWKEKSAEVVTWNELTEMVKEFEEP